VLELPCRPDGGLEPVVDPNLTDPVSPSGAEPEVVLSWTVDLGFERFTGRVQEWQSIDCSSTSPSAVYGTKGAQLTQLGSGP
jgi:hypothetical protein